MRTPYRPEIDGLRTLAVGGVILFHLDPYLLKGGYLGVDVFFVISGFLISSLILRDLEGGGFSFRNFWVRRAKRILPAMLAMITATLAVVWLFGFRGEVPETGAHAVAALFSFANIYSWQQTGDYWGGASESAPLLHAWSLSVEEQFYLFVPLMLFLLFRYARKALPYVVVILVFISFALFLYGTQNHPDATFYLLPTRAWELGVGVVLACTRPLLVGYTWLKQVGALFGVGMIVAAYFLLPHLQSGAPVSVIGTALIIWGGQHGIVYRVLALPPMVYVGKLSYSLYLWHWPVIVLGLEVPEEPMPVWVMLLITAALSLVCYHAIERPLRFAKTSLPYILGAAVAVFLFGLVAYRSSGIYDTSHLPRVTNYLHTYDLRPEAQGHPPDKAVYRTMDFPPRSSPHDAYRTAGIIVGEPDQTPEVVLTGNSHGVMWSNTMYLACEELGVSASIWCLEGVNPAFTDPPEPVYPGLFISQAHKLEYDIARYEKIALWKPKVVFIGIRWDTYNSADQMQQTLSYLSKHAGQVILIGQPPALDFGQKYASQVLAWRGIRNDDNPDIYMDAQARAWEEGNRRAHAFAEQFDNVSVLDTHDLFFDASRTQGLIMSGGEILYYDDDHLSEAGAQRVKQRFIDTIQRHLSESP